MLSETLGVPSCVAVYSSMPDSLRTARTVSPVSFSVTSPRAPLTSTSTRSCASNSRNVSVIPCGYVRINASGRTTTVAACGSSSAPSTNTW